MEIHEVDGRLDALRVRSLGHELLPGRNHILQTEIHGEELSGITLLSLGGLFLHSHLSNHKYGNFVEGLLKLGRLSHSLLDGLLGIFRSQTSSSLKFLAVGRVHGEKHTGSHKVSGIRYETVFNSLSGFSFSLTSRCLKLNLSILIGVQNLEPDLSKGEGRDLKIHFPVVFLQSSQSGIGHHGRHEEVENTGLSIRLQNNTGAIGVGNSEDWNMSEPFLNFLLSHSGVLRQLRSVRSFLHSGDSLSLSLNRLVLSEESTSSGNPKGGRLCNIRYSECRLFSGTEYGGCK
mmetsp:Transcript_21778/g.31796  ORF Transcript_21778/g.31796 Transcript_21778/m.31796 type:complete len:289 (-) Transcript_21778:62-928(-)